MRRHAGLSAFATFVLLVALSGAGPVLGGGVRPPEGSRPNALASADFDEDGVPDLAVASSGRGGGFILLQPGNRDAVYPFEPEARRRRLKDGLDPRAAPPFRGSPPAIALPSPADFLGTGDFDNDGHFD